jgi:hypothetical protein
MVLRFMRKSKRQFYCLLMLGFVLFSAACAQQPPFTGKAFVQELRSAEQATILLNNEKQIIPLQNLDKAKIASIRFTGAYATAFDSLLNKYTQVQSFNGQTGDRYQVL